MVEIFYVGSFDRKEKRRGEFEWKLEPWAARNKESSHKYRIFSSSAFISMCFSI